MATGGIHGYFKIFPDDPIHDFRKLMLVAPIHSFLVSDGQNE